MISPRLLYRRQYVLGPRATNRIPDAQHTPIRDGLVLTAHPDLSVTHVTSADHSITLIGFLLDPRHPEHSDHEILLSLLASCRSFPQLLEAATPLGGKWILVFSDRHGCALFHDPAGTRQVYWCRTSEGTFCASQPHLLAMDLGYTKSEDPDLQRFLNDPAFTERELTWPGDGTDYDEITHLLPNHYLDVLAGQHVRYWPTVPLEPITLTEGVEAIAESLVGTLRSAHARFPLSMAVSAGWDSRVLLAASRGISSDVFYFVQRHGGVTLNSPDIAVSSRLLENLGLTFNIVNCYEYNTDFDRYLRANVAHLQSEQKRYLFYNFLKQFSNRVNVSGNVGEIVRTGRWGSGDQVNARLLASKLGRPDDPFTLRSVQRWLEQASEASSRSGVNLLDLHYWENDIGNWGASFQASLDIAIEELYPFNCRKIIETAYRIPSINRGYPSCDHFPGIARHLWPEVLQQPVNPGGAYQFSSFSSFGLLRELIKRSVARMGLLGIAKGMRGILSARRKK